jgi:hypothetical protein
MVGSTDKAKVRIKARVIKFVKRHLRSVRIVIPASVDDDFTDVPALPNLPRTTAAFINFERAPMTKRSFIRRQTTYDTV